MINRKVVVVRGVSQSDRRSDDMEDHGTSLRQAARTNFQHMSKKTKNRIYKGSVLMYNKVNNKTENIFKENLKNQITVAYR